MNKLNLFINLLPKLKGIKGWLFADGVFKKDRAIILVVALVVLLVAINVLGVQTTTIAIELLDELSDIIGYSSS